VQGTGLTAGVRAHSPDGGRVFLQEGEKVADVPEPRPFGELALQGQALVA